MVLIKKICKNIKQFFFTIIAKKTCLSYESVKAFGYTFLTKQTKLGKNVNFNGFKVLGKGDVIIGDNFHSGFGCSIIAQTHNYKGTALPYDSSYILKHTKIGDNVWLGNNVTILGGVTIGEGVIIQAGSVVVSDIQALSIAGGHPAKVFSKRDEKHYFNLKRTEKFY